MNAIYKFVMAQLAKRGGKTGLPTIQSGKGLNVEFSVKQIEQTLKDMGVDVSKITSPKEVEKFLNIQQSWLNQQVKQKAKNIGLMDPNKNIFMKKGPFEGFTPKVVSKPENIMGGMEGIKARNTKIQDLAAQLAKMQKEKSAMYGKTDIVTDTVTKIKTMEPVAALKEANSVIGRKGIYKNLTKEQSQKILKDTDDWIFQRDPDDLYDYNKKRPFRDDPDVDPEDFAGGGIAGMLGEPTYADEDHRVPLKYGKRPIGEGLQLLDPDFDNDIDIEELIKEIIRSTQEKSGGYQTGGRAGFAEGKGPKMSRRNFLKGLGALAALPVVGKFFKFAKPLAKTSKVADLTSVPIGSVEGMPAWFKPLVNKVIREGESADSWATGVKSVVHKTKLPNSKTTVVVEQQLDTGDVIVDIGVGKHGFADGHHGQPVRLQYKAKELIEPDIDDAGKIKSQGKEVPEEFWVEEAEFTGGHPENIKFEESTIEKFGDHGSNFDEVEKFATGKVKKTKPTKKAERTEYESGKAEADAERVTDEAREDVDFDDLSSDDFAEGGRVPLSGGGLINLAKLMKLFPKIHKDSLLEASRITDSKKLQKMLKSFRKTEEAIDKSPSVELFDLDVKGRKPNATGGRVSLSAGGIAGMLGE